MIIKSSRIPATRTKAITEYLTRPGDNEAVAWRRGSASDIEWMGLAAQTAGQVFAVRHVIIAPEVAMSSEDLRAAVQAVGYEYEVSNLALSQACIVEHVKERAGQGGRAAHFHVALPELDLATGRVMNSRYTRLRDEKLARMLELRLGHPCRTGRFNREVYRALERDFPDLDLLPFQRALEHLSVATGKPPGDWLSFRAKADWPAWRHQIHTRHLARAGNDPAPTSPANPR